MRDFIKHGSVSAILGGQFGSEGKGLAASWLAYRQAPHYFDIYSSNAGAQAGHTSVHQGRTRVVYHLPTAPLIAADCGIDPGRMTIYLNAGAIIDPYVLQQELIDNDVIGRFPFHIHPNCAVITDDCKAAESLSTSGQTKIASTRKGVGEAYARRALRTGLIARDCDELRQYVRRLDFNYLLKYGASVLLEIPQGYGLSLQSQFYPFTTSRDCSVPRGLADADIHPSFYHQTLLVLRSYPIRVGSIPNLTGGMLGYSGDGYADQNETSWEALGLEPEITTVTKRVRRVFTWSQTQVTAAMAAARPTHVLLTHADYLSDQDLTGVTLSLLLAAKAARIDRPQLYWSFGPSTTDVKPINSTDLP